MEASGISIPEWLADSKLILQSKLLNSTKHNFTKHHRLCSCQVVFIAWSSTKVRECTGRSEAKVLIWGCKVTEGWTWDQWHLSWFINACVAIYHMAHFGYLLPINSAWSSGRKYLSQHGHTQSNILPHSNLISRSVSPESSSWGTNNVDTSVGQVWQPALRCPLPRITWNSFMADDGRCGMNEILLLSNS